MLEHFTAKFVDYLAMASAFGVVLCVLVAAAYITYRHLKQRALNAVKRAPGVAADHAASAVKVTAQTALDGARAVAQGAPGVIRTIRRNIFDRWSRKD